MSTSGFIEVFPRQLRKWALHSCVNALPSFAIALFILGLWKIPSAVMAMLCAIAVIVLIYAVITSLLAPFSEEHHILARSLNLALKIRMWIVCISALVIPTPVFLITPDFWCGLWANGILGGIAKAVGASGHWDVGIPTGQSFLPVFSVTLMEGLILSILLMMISFFSIIFLQARDRRKRFESGPSGLL